MRIERPQLLQGRLALDVLQFFCLIANRGFTMRNNVTFMEQYLYRLVFREVFPNRLDVSAG